MAEITKINIKGVDYDIGGTGGGSGKKTINGIISTQTLIPELFGNFVFVFECNEIIENEANTTLNLTMEGTTISFDYDFNNNCFYTSLDGQRGNGFVFNYNNKSYVIFNIDSSTGFNISVEGKLLVVKVENSVNIDNFNIRLLQTMSEKNKLFLVDTGYAISLNCQLGLYLDSLGSNIALYGFYYNNTSQQIMKLGYEIDLNTNTIQML